MSFEILPPKLAIKSMRSSGYRDTAHAIAELIDNSVEAGLPLNQCTKVEVLCVERRTLGPRREKRELHQIAVYDDASGMDAQTLRIALQFGNGTHLDSETQKGIGKFGMGLPNASISQCRRVDVYSWQGGRVLHTYLDVDEIEDGRMREVPEPRATEIPDYWQGMISDSLKPHGTLVIWSELDRVSWKASKALFDNTEFLIGRIYRYFLANQKLSIRLATYEVRGNADPVLTSERSVRPNDPLYLMTGTNCPHPYDNEPAFDFFTETKISVEHAGRNHDILVRYSIVSPRAREQGGSSPIGRHAARNQGISLVRAGRELELNKAFVIGYDPRERWWGIEVLFEPGLDDIFGVTNNKQAATNFGVYDLEEDAKAEGMSPSGYTELLKNNEDPRWVLYDLSQEINSKLRTLREQIRRMEEGRRGRVEVAPPGSAEYIATQALRRRRERLGTVGHSDMEERAPATVRIEQLAQELEREGIEEERARKIAVQAVKRQVKFLFEKIEIPGTVFFDVRSKAGTIIVNINSRHPVSSHLFNLLEPEGNAPDPPELVALKLLFTAWARMEDEANDERRRFLEETRQDWGRIARDFLEERT